MVFRFAGQLNGSFQFAGCLAGLAGLPDFERGAEPPPSPASNGSFQLPPPPERDDPRRPEVGGGGGSASGGRTEVLTRDFFEG